MSKQQFLEFRGELIRLAHRIENHNQDLCLRRIELNVNAELDFIHNLQLKFDDLLNTLPED